MDYDDDLTKFAANGAAPLPPDGTHGYVDHESARIAYATYGSGAAVLLLHGAFDNGEDWGFQVGALLAAGHRVVLIDNRGRGRSTLGTRPLGYGLLASEVFAVMDSLDIARASVVGWSDGAVIALVMAMRNPARVASVFSFGGAMNLDGLKPMPIGNPLLGRVFARAKLDYVRLSPTPEGFDTLCRAMDQLQTEPSYSAAELAGIDTRVAIVHAENDEFILRAHAEYLARTLPQAELVLLDGVSHFAMLQRPDTFNDAMLTFLDA